MTTRLLGLMGALLLLTGCNRAEDATTAANARAELTRIVGRKGLVGYLWRRATGSPAG